MQNILEELYAYIYENYVVVPGILYSKERFTFNPKEYVKEELRKATMFNEYLCQLMLEKKITTNSAFYTKARIDRRHFHKLVHNKVVPQRETVLALAIALELTFVQTEQLLQTVGYTFNNTNISDLVIKFFILRQHYDRTTIDDALENMGQRPLSGW